MDSPHARIPGGHRAARHPRARRVVLTAVGTLAAGAVGVLAVNVAAQPSGKSGAAAGLRGSGDASGGAVSPGAQPTESASPSASTSASGTPSPGASSASASASAAPAKSASGDPVAKAAAPAAPKPSATAKKPAPRDPAPAPAPAGEAAEVIRLVNVERGKAGCGALTSNAKLTQAAQSYTEVMARSGELSHTGPDGSTMSGRISATGYKWSATGENIAKGQANAAEVVDAWMKSPGHRANILNCKFTEIGVGVQKAGGPWWTQDFARPQ
ncbi:MULTISPECIES: CAP domain-containing protein [unclassified Streptomyces]|uniref:CAP domain-containing protein n=1 Tax=unclassified Streptomyces TaxID=2593676 RepID=UPI002250ED24|nr:MULTISPECIES: CAP domain-containing protein [unclassified Streptomyces]MCX4529593.1 CAP domain-containing protein [Streptomyces sp. NBC_01551]MCX4539834.1 CAP domain-containing protein [Streptomyces sp. NBC_01565]